ncbi:MAG: acyltransferase family protein [Anaerolineae bacterium]
MAVLEVEQFPSAVRTEAATTRVAEDQMVYVKVVRALAMCVIVTLHVAFPLIYLYNSASYDNWWIATMFYAWGKVGSPLFTMVSGLLLLNPAKDQPIPVFFKKRFMKVLLPFIAWVFIYLLWRILFYNEMLSLHDILVAAVQGPMYYHLWFIQMILGLYLATPILRIYIRHASRSNLTYFLSVWFIANSVLPIFQRFTGIEVGIDIVVTSNYVGYFVLGHYLRDATIQRKHILPLMMAIVAALVFTQVATLKMTEELQGTFDNFFLLHESFNLVVIAVCAFLLLKSLNYNMIFSRMPFLNRGMLLISNNSLGIYFIHVMFIDLLASGRLGFVLSASSWHPLFAIPLVAIIALVASIISVTVMKKVPVLRNIVP